MFEQEERAVWNGHRLVVVLSTHPMAGRRYRLLIDGEETFDSILEDIRQAEEYVLVQFYIVRDDGLGRRLKEAMI